MSVLEIIRALHDENRLRLTVLLSSGTFTGQELIEILEVSQPTVSHHLKILQSAGIVKARKEAQWCLYTLAPDAPLAREIVRHASDEPNGKLDQDRRRALEVVERRKERSRDYFNAVARYWLSLREKIHGPATPWEELLRRIPAEAAVLELGCGTGILLDKIRKRPGISIGVDSSPAMLEQAQKNSPGADLRLGYLEHLPVGDLSIDVAVASLVFHHLPDRALALRDIARVLKPGGTLLILDRTENASEELRQEFQGLWFDFTTDEIVTDLAAVGLRREEFTVLGDGNFFLLSAVKM